MKNKIKIENIEDFIGHKKVEDEEIILTESEWSRIPSAEKVILRGNRYIRVNEVWIGVDFKSPFNDPEHNELLDEKLNYLG